MAAGEQYHDFYAALDGRALRFTMACRHGRPVWIGERAPIEDRALEGRIKTGLDLVNHLLRSDAGVWAMLRSQRAGVMGAVIEAAEARRAEIYGERGVAA